MFQKEHNNRQIMLRTFAVQVVVLGSMLRVLEPGPDWLRHHGGERLGGTEVSPPGSKVPKSGVSMVSVLGIGIMVWCIYFIFEYLDPQGQNASR